MALIDLGVTSGRGYQGHQEQPGLRLCSQACAAIAQEFPEKYRAIAFASIVRAHHSAVLSTREVDHE